MAISPIIDVERFQQDVSISEIDINSAFKDQASLFGYYAGLHLKAMRQAGNAKITRDATEAKIDAEIRQKYIDDLAAAGDGAKIKAPTESQIQAQINRDPRFITVRKEYQDADAILTFISNALEAFKQRRDMLISLGANVREEMKGDLRLNMAQRAADALSAATSASSNSHRSAA